MLAAGSRLQRSSASAILGGGARRAIKQERLQRLAVGMRDEARGVGLGAGRGCRRPAVFVVASRRAPRPSSCRRARRRPAPGGSCSSPATRRSAEARAERLAQQVQADAVAGGEPDAFARGLASGASPSTGRSWRAAAPSMPVDLVVDQQLRDVAGADFLQHLVDLGDALVAQRVGGVDHVQQQVGLARFGQGRAERGDQFVRQVAHEADGVGQHHARRPAASMRRTVGSSVANNWSAA